RSMVPDSTVTVTFGEQGAILLDRGPFLIHVPAVNVEASRLTGAGDICASTAALAEALGKSAEDAALLAAVDAGRWVSGRAPASSLAELEDELRRRPEMSARFIPFPAVA